MVRVILIADMMGRMDQRMEGKRSKPYQQKHCCKLKHSISLELNHNFPGCGGRLHPTGFVINKKSFVLLII